MIENKSIELSFHLNTVKLGNFDAEFESSEYVTAKFPVNFSVIFQLFGIGSCQVLSCPLGSCIVPPLVNGVSRVDNR